MAKYAIVPKRPILIAGVQVTPEDKIATIETDLPVHDLLALVQFRNAGVESLEADEDFDEDDPMQSPFAAYSEKTQQLLDKAGIKTLPQAALWLRDNQDFTKLGIAKTVAADLVKQLETANIPAPTN